MDRLERVLNTKLIDVTEKEAGVLNLLITGNITKEDGELSPEIGIDKLITIKTYDEEKGQWVDNDNQEEVESYKEYIKENLGMTFEELEGYAANPIEEGIEIPDSVTLFLHTGTNRVYFKEFEVIPKAERLTNQDLFEMKCKVKITGLYYNDKTGYQLMGTPDMEDKKTAKNFGAYEGKFFNVRMKYHNVLERVVNGEKKFKNILDMKKIASSDKKLVRLLDTDDVDINNLKDKLPEIQKDIVGKSATFVVKKAGTNLYFDADVIEYDI